MRARVVALVLLAACVLAPASTLARERRTVDLDVVGVDIRNVLRLLADVGHVNLVIADEVTGQVTVRFHGVPWQRALDAILGSKGYEAVRDGNIVRVASQASFAKERAARIDEHAMCLETAPLLTRLIPVSYADPEALAAIIRPRLTKRGSVTVDGRTHTLIVTDVVGCD